jgi:dTDP-4-amino-4,6-dideoxygalactose transaminase
LVVCAGTNGKMTEASAAMGLTSLDSADRFLAANRTNHAQYASCLAGVEGVEVCSYGTEDRSNYSYVAISVDAAAFGMSRDSLRNLLWSEGVLARRYFYPGCHRSEPYASASGARRDLSITDEVAEKVLVLPTGTATSTEDVTAICQLIRVAAANPWVATHAKQHRR